MNGNPSSDRQVGDLNPPPRGSAPGARRASHVLVTLLAETLDKHHPAPVWCACGWRAPLSLNDTTSDRNQTRAHVAAEQARAVAAWIEADEQVETIHSALAVAFGGRSAVTASVALAALARTGVAWVVDRTAHEEETDDPAHS